MTSGVHFLKVKNQMDTKLLNVTSLVISEAISTSGEVKRHTHKVVATSLAEVEAMIWPLSQRQRVFTLGSASPECSRNSGGHC